jgi:hypothetical protein
MALPRYTLPHIPVKPDAGSDALRDAVHFVGRVIPGLGADKVRSHIRGYCHTAVRDSVKMSIRGDQSCQLILQMRAGTASAPGWGRECHHGSDA